LARFGSRRRFLELALAATVLGCTPAVAPRVNATLARRDDSNLTIADALEALIATKADTPGDRRYAYERVRSREARTPADALARAIVAGRLAQVSGLGAPGLVAEVERYARLSVALDPAFRDGAAQRLLGTLYVLAPATLLEHGDSEEGLELLQAVVRRFPDRPVNRLRLAEAYVALDDPVPARPHLCSCRARRAELRQDEQALLDELLATAKVTSCP
jgi:hypothetical protein